MSVSVGSRVSPGPPSRWLRTSGAGPAVELNVVCFPPAGGAAGSFAALRRAAGPETSVTAVLLPGREARIAEPHATDLHRLAATVAGELLPLLARDETPYVLLGHSLGGLLAYEVALGLDGLGARPPLTVVVAGTAAPRHACWSAVASRRPDELLRLLGGVPQELLDMPQLLDLAVEVLRADLAMVEGYRCSDGLLPAPLEVLYGSEDPLVDAAAVAGWARLAGAGVAFEGLSGGHFFLDEHHPRLLAAWHEAAAR
ncbi:alpha/beta fold hydrolase [Kitasatospora albolonga]|uniref:thioesterase II family protein n=1 Tax=Kitasatospora albolonga TaxID=68173 RepID=UPI0031E941D4